MTVNSTAIKSLSYNAAKKELTIVFASGHGYIYQGVSRRTRDKVRNAPSIGRAYHQYIRGRFAARPASA